MTAPWPEWPEKPVPLTDAVTLPHFPVTVLPPWLAAMVDATATFTQTPPDLAASVGLAVLSTAAGGRAVVEVRGHWREPVNLFAVVALASGNRKSAVFQEMVRPVLDTERELTEQAGPGILEAETLRRIAEAEAEKLTRAAASQEKDEDEKKTRDAKKKTREDKQAEAIAAAKMAEAVVVPAMPRLFADDATPESVVSLMAEQGGRLAILSAEGTILGIVAGRYSGGVPVLECLLKGHAGDTLRVDRKGRPPEYIRHPALTMGLAVQPEVLRSLPAMPGARGRGLLARFLYAMPASMVGHREIGPPEVPPEVARAYAEQVRTLILTMAEWQDPAVLPLSREARQAVLAAEAALEPRLDPDTGDLAGITDWAAKSVGAAVRIAGLLHLGDHPEDGWSLPVDGQTMRRALRITDYFTGHARAVFGFMAALDPVTADALEVLRWLRRVQSKRVTVRECFAGVSRSRFPKVTDLAGPLAVLEAHGWITRLPDPPREGPGRPPSPAYATHPDLAAESAEPQKGPPGTGGFCGSADYADAPEGWQR